MVHSWSERRLLSQPSVEAALAGRVEYSSSAPEVPSECDKLLRRLLKALMQRRLFGTLTPDSLLQAQSELHINGLRLPFIKKEQY